MWNSRPIQLPVTFICPPSAAVIVKCCPMNDIRAFWIVATTLSPCLTSKVVWTCASDLLISYSSCPEVSLRSSERRSARSLPSTSKAWFPFESSIQRSPVIEISFWFRTNVWPVASCSAALAAGAGATNGGGAEAPEAGATPGPTGAPQLTQNLASSAKLPPHCVQNIAKVHLLLTGNRTPLQYARAGNADLPRAASWRIGRTGARQKPDIT